MKVLITAPYVHNYLGEWQREFPQVEFLTGQTPAEILAAAAEAEVAFGPVNQDLLRAAPKLRWIQSGSAGVEWMQAVPDLRETEILVTNTRGAHATTIAEHTFGMLIFLARNFAQLYENQKEHVWDPKRMRGCYGLVGMTMGIIGLGQIGRAIAKRAHAFEMKVIAVDAHPVQQPDYVAELRLLDGLDDLLERSDVVVIAIPITPETRGMIGRAQLQKLKQDAFLMVMSRGGIVDEATVAAMLREGKLAGAGFDVTAVEPLPTEHELWSAPNVFITPHCSPASEQTRANVTTIMKDNLRRYLAGEPLTNLVDKRLGY
jgi:phosphoglycerate dehydrogenase-like enzyme